MPRKVTGSDTSGALGFVAGIPALQMRWQRLVLGICF